MICLAELYVKDFVSIPPDTINFAAPEGLPAGDSVTNPCSPEELRSYQPIQNSEEAFFLNFLKDQGALTHPDCSGVFNGLPEQDSVNYHALQCGDLPNEILLILYFLPVKNANLKGNAFFISASNLFNERL
jgi:hypothetical protein